MVKTPEGAAQIAKSLPEDRCPGEFPGVQWICPVSKQNSCAVLKHWHFEFNFFFNCITALLTSCRGGCEVSP